MTPPSTPFLNLSNSLSSRAHHTTSQNLTWNSSIGYSPKITCDCTGLHSARRPLMQPFSCLYFFKIFFNLTVFYKLFSVFFVSFTTIFSRKVLIWLPNKEKEKVLIFILKIKIHTCSIYNI